ncbi:hypothetical protein GQ457_09G008670 [Hibiscus cannabinus]
MGCGISKIDIPKGGDSSQLYSQLAIVHGSNDRSLSSRHAPTGCGSYHKKRGDVGKEEACIDKESSSEGDFNDRCDGVSYMASPSFKVYCVPSQLDDGSSEGDSNPDEIMDPKMDLGYYNKGCSGGCGKTNAPSRKEKKPFRGRCFRRMSRSK